MSHTTCIQILLTRNNNICENLFFQIIQIILNIEEKQSYTRVQH
jgi:hypothetical protein